MSKTAINFTNLYNDLSSVTAQAVINRLQLKSASLRKFLQNEFEVNFGKGNDFLAQPIFEATFGWQPAEDGNDLCGLVDKGILTKSLVNNLAYPPMPYPEEEKDFKEYIGRGIGEERWHKDIQEDYEWPMSRKPYKHQLEAWKHLISDDVKSVVVTSGTGSGKTECFLVPLLNDLAKQADVASQRLEGTQAIFLYPLNALINSQKERLSAWTRGFNGKVRFALYNGETPEFAEFKNNENASDHSAPELVSCRRDIWSSPPPILVTNATMLEYMLVRQKDEDILAKSQGKLKWIVLDEAHTYVGSQAAEISLLLRRVMHAYGVKPEDVRFVATSATIGDKNKQQETNNQLQEFLAKLAGVKIDQVEVVNGQRIIPPIDESKNQTHFNFELASQMLSGELFDYLCSFPTFRTLRQKMTLEPLSLEDVTEVISPELAGTIDKKALARSLKLIDLAVTAFHNGDQNQQAFLPVRAHIFHRAQRGLWACMDPNCPEKTGTALENGWKFGMVYTHERSHCECGAPVFELTHCNDCGTPSLAAAKNTADGGIKLIEPREVDLLDDYADEIESRGDELSEEEEENLAREFEVNVQIFAKEDALANAHDKLGCTHVYIDPKTKRVSEKYEEGYLDLYYNQNERNDGLRCACCNGVEHTPNTRFKRALLGSPFLMGSLVPALLRHIPSDDPDSMKGKRLITFTDSRQGTARFSAKMQLDSERNWARSFIYKEALKSADISEIPENLKGQLDLIEVLSMTPGNETTIQTIQQLVDNELAKLSPSFISWEKLKISLSQQEVVQLLSGEYLASINDDQYKKELEKIPGEYAKRLDCLGNSEVLAHLFLLREFARRGKNANNLESMGLVQLRYPAIESLQSDDLFNEWKLLGLTLEELKDYLKICLDFYIRENTIIDIAPDVINWMGAKIMPRIVKEPGYVFLNDEEKIACYRFPQVNKGNQHRLIRLLELATGRIAKNEKALFNDVLKSVWNILTLKLKLLTTVSRPEYKSGTAISGYQFVFDKKVEFSPIKNAWLCPITGRWLDTTFRGLTPYTTGSSTIEDVKCKEELHLAIEHPDWHLLEQPKESIREWLDCNETIINHRSQGRWSDINDKVIAGVELIRAAEHSAQQDSNKLKELEKAFKKDHLNVLSCSTTMEMGVDIGSLSMVAMNNVPPTTSNYLQRAGRAGRRSESTSLALTFCKATPHGEHVFSNPKWPFTTPIRVPKVSLDSSVIVQRHINAFLLASFLKREKKKSDNLLTMQTGAFYLDELGICPVEAFKHWLSDTTEKEIPVSSGIDSLKFDSAYSNFLNQTLIMNALRAISESQSKWKKRYDALDEQLKNASGSDNGATNKLKRQLDRVAKDYLLAELANTSYLPGYGFPTGVVQLITENRSEKFVKDKKEQQARKAYPSRSLDVALREYAPGAEIVKDGAVYRSQGLQLNWKMPFSDNDIKQEQLIQYQWECRSCGAIGIESESHNKHEKCCPECDSDTLLWNEFIVPSGFVVDYNKSLHNNYVQPNYLGYKEGKVSISDEPWQPLLNKGLGRFRVSNEGTIFHYNDGFGGGYAMCWCCGRAEALCVDKMPNGRLKLSQEPKVLGVHRRLQGFKVKGELSCDSTKFSHGIKLSELTSGSKEIKQPFILGYPQKTAIFELQLRNPLTGSWVYDEKWMYTLGAALRQMYAHVKGITTQELGLTFRNKRNEFGESVTSLFIYDSATQGAGFASSIPDILNKLWAGLEMYLRSCPAKCKTACHSCFLDYDTQYNIKNLDRNYLLNALEENKFLSALFLSDNRKYFGEYSYAELLNVKQILSKIGTTCLSAEFFIIGDDWSWGDWIVRDYIIDCCAKKIPVTLYLSEQAASKVDSDLAWEISRYLPLAKVNIQQLKQPIVLEHEGTPLMRLNIIEGGKWFAVESLENVSANGCWGNITDNCVVSGFNDSVDIFSEAFDLINIAKSSELDASAIVIEDFSSLQCNVKDFGKNFINLFESGIPNLSERLENNVESITYSDKYVVSPLTVVLVNKILVEMQSRYGKFSAELHTVAPKQSDWPSKTIAHNFLSETDLNDFIFESSRRLGGEVYGDIFDNEDLPHSRIMQIDLKDGSEIKLLLDHGMGYWSKGRNYKDHRFDFDHAIEEAMEVSSWSFSMKDAGTDTYIAIKL
ncbi:DEAD/DEAH box helicase [Vibrio fluvialis]|uniref:DEAD/DEAH box helicase n=1 Tax=Vibrio fluvialis TaxID=676 RepID=UPI001EEB9C3F|nr:DEAD/DEAH box helicase [Vibrio fluvialis]EKO3382284.1 DEAD/DEAH box helicase [Vibrio fluvialis]MCG6373386.1 DEAD/DEAH box helicase [Vibrio fluvialis]